MEIGDYKLELPQPLKGSKIKKLILIYISFKCGTWY